MNARTERHRRQCIRAARTCAKAAAGWAVDAAGFLARGNALQADREVRAAAVCWVHAVANLLRACNAA